MVEADIIEQPLGDEIEARAGGAVRLRIALAVLERAGREFRRQQGVEPVRHVVDAGPPVVVRGGQVAVLDLECDIVDAREHTVDTGLAEQARDRAFARNALKACLDAVLVGAVEQAELAKRVAAQEGVERVDVGDGDLAIVGQTKALDRVHDQAVHGICRSRTFADGCTGGSHVQAVIIGNKIDGAVEARASSSDDPHHVSPRLHALCAEHAQGRFKYNGCGRPLRH